MKRLLLFALLLSTGSVFAESTAHCVKPRTAVTFPVSFWKSGITPTPSPTVTPTPTPTPTATPTPTPSPTPATPTPTPTPPPSPQTLTYVSDGDTNDLFYFIGTNLGTAGWTNPHTATLLTIGAFNSSNSSDIAAGTEAGPVDRSYADENRTSNAPASYWRLQLPVGQTIQVQTYSFKCRPTGQGTASNIADLKLQGSSNGSSWTDLDTQTGLTYVDSDDWKTFTVPGAAAWRYIRILHQGNTTPANDFFFLTEWQIYGIYSY